MDVHENNRDHLDAFIKLNEAWIEKYFELEESDRELAENPSQVIDDGGYIFSLVENDEVVGVCALFNMGGGVYELARMAVCEDEQGKGFGKVLIEAAIEKAREIRAKKIVLLSNTKLSPAIRLYKKYGFKTVSEGPHPVYSRCNIVMELGER